MNREISLIDHHQPLVLLGGSISDWLVLVGGIVLAGICTAMFAL